MNWFCLAAHRLDEIPAIDHSDSVLHRLLHMKTNKRHNKIQQLIEIAQLMILCACLLPIILVATQMQTDNYNLKQSM